MTVDLNEISSSFTIFIIFFIKCVPDNYGLLRQRTNIDTLDQFWRLRKWGGIYAGFFGTVSAAGVGLGKVVSVVVVAGVFSA